MWLCSSHQDLRSGVCHVQTWPYTFLHVCICLLDGWNGDASSGNSGNHELKIALSLDPWIMTFRKAVPSSFSLPRLPLEQKINFYCVRAITHYKVCLLQQLAFPTSSWRHPHVMTLAARTGIPHLLWKKRFSRMAYPPKNYLASLSLPSGGPRNWEAPNCYLKPGVDVCKDHLVYAWCRWAIPPNSISKHRHSMQGL